ncbi:hypothetical protein SAMN04488515_1292 [Cognatiyoonia koreensis]|uniref:Haemolysin XhlA n=1 Tax=Cognatiyoonia koreensis TaxID=364200 RepID=A0A1I0PLF3_9RHOB|nr:pseudouridine synthase [Cognatiyoonia koreensis]SEW15081.1 hypothetical protein SAMN04488515_1292 [Cognatiyoonia koreensis]
MTTDWVEKIERRLAVIETRNAVDAVHRDNVTDRLVAIEDTLKWLVRLIIGGLLLGGLTFALQGGLML